MLTSTTETPARPAVALLPEWTVLRGARRLLILSLIAGVAYSFFSTASRVAKTAPAAPDHPAYSIDLTLHPSPLVYVAIAIVFFSAIQRVLTRANNEATALRTFRRASRLVLFISLGSAVIALVWFFTYPLGGWPETNMWIAPFPFGTMDVTTKMITEI